MLLRASQGGEFRSQKIQTDPVEKLSACHEKKIAVYSLSSERPLPPEVSPIMQNNNTVALVAASVAFGCLS
ncbi:hypothetical protein OP10G_1758 [Fimbriimonas ginsengisoli Gsoil 348]|uniref:Uncharacterized protein n=1 Tax=Fimbriimonas ginsengisoli Gsoil 348 TaxID=661478 RepID=A0A068NNW6_FIMGI|nr:hypothetical protein OP10G_1758 [Fimbriimonas ginsengisoli Gsoil 348]